MLHGRAIREDRLDPLADHRLVVGVVAVHEVAVDVVEVGDDHEVEVALVHSGVAADLVAADLGDARRAGRPAPRCTADRSAAVASGFQRNITT